MIELVFFFPFRFSPESRVMRSNSQEELTTFVVTFLRSSKYIKNPYLKAKLVEVSLCSVTLRIAQSYLLLL